MTSNHGSIRHERGEEFSVLWSKAMFAQLAEGGVWGVPRSGLLFQKRDDKLVLIDAMPHMEGMPISDEELREQQKSDFENIRDVFKQAGIEVISEAVIN